MEAKEITTVEGNALIAVFMGFKYLEAEAGEYLHIPSGGWTWAAFKHGIWSKEYDWYSVLLYHKDWNWLMPVVEKIHDITSDHDQQFAGLKIFELALTAERQTVWQAVVEYIQWYNAQK